MRQSVVEQVAQLTATLSRPRYLRIVAEIAVHESRKGPRCPCCRSKTAAIVERIPAADLVIDLESGDRIVREDVSVATWDDLCALAELHEVPIRCHLKQLPLLLDDTGRHLYASGASRSGKTAVALYWLALQIIRRGGRGRRFWLVAQILPDALVLLKRLFLGDEDAPAILPEALVEYMPSTERAGDKTTLLVDGSEIALKFFKGDPDASRLKRDPIIAAVIDEACHLPAQASLAALRNRCLDYGGRLFFASTPVADSFIKESIVDKALDFERLPDTDPQKINGAHEGARYLYAEIPVTDNPWMDQDEIKAEMATLDLTQPANQRDYFGRWVSSTGPFWLDYDTERHTYVHEARDFKELGVTFLGEMGLSNQIDITTRVVSRIFRGRNPHYKGMQATNKRYLLGTDVNCHPMSTVIMQISGDRDKPDDKDLWHYWILDVVRTAHGNSFAHVNQLKSTFFGKILEPGQSKPFDGCGVVIDAKALGRDPTAHRFGGDPRGIAELFGRANMDVRAPEYKMTEKGSVPVPPGRWDSYSSVVRLLRDNRIHVAQRASGVQEAFARQQDSGNGHEPQKNDPLDSAMDGMRYAIWATLRTRARDSDNES